MYPSGLIHRLVSGGGNLTCIIRMTLCLNSRDQTESRNDCNARTPQSWRAREVEENLQASKQKNRQ